MVSKVILFIVPREAMENGLAMHGYYPNRDGKAISTDKELKFNGLRDNDGNPAYSIIYTDDVFARMDIRKFVFSLIKTFHTNRPNDIMELSIVYAFNSAQFDYDMFDEATASQILTLNSFACNIIESNRLPIFQYNSDSIGDMADELLSRKYIGNDLDDEDDEDDDDEYVDPWDYDDDEDDDDEDDEEDDEDHIPEINADNPYEFFLKENKPMKSKKRYFDNDFRVTRSKVFRNAKNAKRDIARHGIIVYNKKSDLERDRDQIKEFLKQFIPGNKQWIKKFRKDILNRWISMYTISKKMLSVMEREHRNRRRSQMVSSGYSLLNAGLQITNKVLNSSRSNDKWNNPNM